MSRAHHKGSAPSQRMLRVAEQIRHVLARIFARSRIDDPELNGKVINITEVRMSPDLKLATVSVLPLGGEGAEALAAILERHKKFLRGELGHELNLKFAPDLRFRADTGFLAGSKVDELLASAHVRRDLVDDDGADEEHS